MARLITSGAETREKTAEGLLDVGTFPPAADTGTKRSGAVSWKLDSGGVNSATYLIYNFTGALGTTYYMRSYFNFTTLPTATTTDLLQASGAYTVTHKTADNKLYLRYAGSDIGSGSAAITTGVWYRVEMAWRLGTGALDYAEFMLDGVSVASETNANRTDTLPTSMRIGLASAPGANIVAYEDDIAINDSSGSAQNSWPGDGAEVLLVPTADSAVGTGWTLGTGTAIASNSGSTAVKNTPPVGVADLTAGSDTKQIRNATSNANSNYDATMTTYTAAGVPAGSTINVVDPIVATAAPVSTSAKAGTVGVVSNPAITNVNLGAGGTSGAFWSGTAAGTYPTGWKISHGTVTYVPTVTLGTAPVMRITQVTSSTRIAMVCFMGIYVDYTAPQPLPIFVTAVGTGSSV